MGKLGAPEIILIISIALLIFGPTKLPQLGRSVGETMMNFKKGLKEAHDETNKDEEN